MLAEKDSASPPGSPKPIQKIALPPGFKEVTACLQRDPAIPIKAPLELMQLEVMAEPVVAMMCTSSIVQDEITGVTYMDTVTTSVGRVVLMSSCLMTETPRLTIQDVTNLP